jgi:membrane-associated phospholipid phosphatase
MYALDLAGLRTLYGGPHPSAFGYVMIALTILGEGWTMLALLPLLAVRRARRPALVLLVTGVVTAAIVALIKLVVHRIRPWIALSLVPVWGTPHDFSFPSGHATGGFTFAAFGIALMLAQPPRRPWAIAGCAGLLVIAIGIALSRVYLGVHYPSDVIGGGAIGVFVGSTAGVWHTRRARSQHPTSV